LLPLCEERPCVELDCSDASLPGCVCTLDITGHGIFCSPGYPLCETLECDALDCPIVGSNACYCLRPPLAPQPCVNGGPIGVASDSNQR
jgi:hypothetical protein